MGIKQHSPGMARGEYRLAGSGQAGGGPAAGMRR